MSETVTIGRLVEPEYSQATCELRFVRGRLQQAWHVGRSINDAGKIRTERIEWRDVPSIEIADANPKATP